MSETGKYYITENKFQFSIKAGQHVYCPAFLFKLVIYIFMNNIHQMRLIFE